MVYYLCKIFAGCEVDGIHFEYVKKLSKVDSFEGRQTRFNTWKNGCLESNFDDMIGEYIRLTNIAFAVDCPVPPVFLLDEIQILLPKTTVRSDYDEHRHSHLSLLLTQLAGDYNPLCICTGTNNGRLLKITEKSLILPQILFLTPLRTGYMQNWREMTDHENAILPKGHKSVPFDAESELIHSLICASYKIPRLLVLAHIAWFEGLKKKDDKSVHILFEFERNAGRYYSEMFDIWRTFKPEDVAHVIFATGCNWPVSDSDSNIPGTRISWNSLIQKSLIFPYDSGCYLFPYGLVWSYSNYLRSDIDSVNAFRKEVKAVCQSLVKNVEIEHLFTRYSKFAVSSVYNRGMLFEEALTASLAVKYYLCQLGKLGAINVKFTSIYLSSEKESLVLLQNRTVDFSRGIKYPSDEATVDGTWLDRAVSRNREKRQALHDMILYSKEGLIAVQAKASPKAPSSKIIDLQLKRRRGEDDKVDVLIWMSLCDFPRVTLAKKFADRVVFLNGYGVCNGISLDMIRALKAVEST